MKVDPSVVYTREQVVANLRQAVSSSPVSFDFLLKQAEVESGLNPNAKAATSSAAGPFQFVNGTWLRMVEKYGDNVGLSEQAAALRENKLDGAAKADLLALRTDVAISGKMAAHFAIDNAKSLMSSGLHDIGPTELYLAHFLGAGGAKEFLTAMQANPNAPAAEAVPAAAKANKGVFFAEGLPRSFAEIYNRFAQKFAGVSTPLMGSPEAMGQMAQATPVDQSRMQAGAPNEFDVIAQQTLAEARASTNAVQRVQAERAQQSSLSTEELTANMAEMSEAALSHYLQSFAKAVDDPNKAPLVTTQSDTRDASRGASDEGAGHVVAANLFSQQDVALGMKIVMDSAGKRPASADHAASDLKNTSPTLAPAVRQAVQWVSLFSDPRGADAAQGGRA